jgi:hypothetical protein
MHRHQPPRIASWACNIRSQVPSRFDQDSDRDSDPVRIVGVALLNLGSDDRRVLAPIEFSGHRQLQTADVPRSAFELERRRSLAGSKNIGPHRASRIRTVTSSLEAFTTALISLLYALSLADGKQEASPTPL